LGSLGDVATAIAGLETIHLTDDRLHFMRIAQGAHFAHRTRRALCASLKACILRIAQGVHFVY
jgi:hypothetical protein